jgi:DNA-binding transcriptional LysR family regulator
MMRPYEQRFPWTLDWNLLRTFMVIVQQGGVTKAATVLGLKQPTISSALKRLEESVGYRLIVRNPNSFRVTRAGRALYQECTAVFGSISQIPSLLEAGEAELTGHVSIVATSHVVSPHVDAVLASFAQDYPKVTFSVVVADSAEVVALIEQNRASFGICLLGSMPRTLDARVLFREHFALYCGKRNRLFGKDVVTLEDMRGEGSVSFQTEQEGGPLDSVRKLRERAHLAPGPRGISANLPEVRRMIIANIGIGALPVHVAERDVTLGLLRRVPTKGSAAVIDIFLLSNPRRKPTAAEGVLLERFHSMIEDTPITDRTYGG